MTGDASLKLCDKLTWISEILSFVLKKFYKNFPTRYKSISTEVICELAHNIIFFVFVVAKAGALCLLTLVEAFATTVPVQVWAER